MSTEGGRRLAVAAVVRRPSDGRYLLIRRAEGRPAAGYWAPVTGTPEPGETLAEAAAREVREEVGLEVRVGAEVHRCPTEGAPFDLVWFAATPLAEGPLVLRAIEVAEARWAGLDEALSLAPMFAATRAYFAGLTPRD